MRGSSGVVLAGLTVFLVAVLFWGVQAQQPAAPPAPSTSTKEAKGRLPRFYDVVVTPKQRKLIYEIQQKYEVQIRRLLQQIEALKKQRDREIEAVLDEEQREIVARLRALAERQKQKQKKKATPKTP